MKKRFIIISSILITTVLFSILFQSIHSFEHFSKQLTEKKCLHKYNSSQEITHQHHNLDHCFVCETTLGNYIPTEIFTYRIFLDNTNIPFLVNVPETIYPFSGIYLSLRGPPQFIV